MILLEWLPFICLLVIILFFAWQLTDRLSERRQKQDNTPKPETDAPQISYVQPGDGGKNIPMQ